MSYVLLICGISPINVNLKEWDQWRLLESHLSKELVLKLILLQLKAVVPSYNHLWEWQKSTSLLHCYFQELKRTFMQQSHSSVSFSPKTATEVSGRCPASQKGIRLLKVTLKYLAINYTAWQQHGLQKWPKRFPSWNTHPAVFSPSFSLGGCFFSGLRIFIKRFSCSLKVISKFDLRSIYCFL